MFGVLNRLWLDNLLMRAIQEPEEDFEFITTYPGSWLFGTRLTFQGSGNSNMSALAMFYEENDPTAQPLVYLESALLLAVTCIAVWKGTLCTCSLR